MKYYLFFLMAGLVSFSARATTLTIYPVKDGCKYILSEEKSPVLSWISSCSSKLHQAKNITIKKQSLLGRQILRIRPEQHLENIQVVHLTDPEIIRKVELDKIPEINIEKFRIEKNITINAYVNQQLIVEAQDYNSSRSNKPRPIWDVNDNPRDSIPQPSEAQDYNSSRSNKPRPIWDINDNPRDSIPQPSEAQDYNSSRSNKPRPIRKINDNPTDSIAQPSEAQDYNSSRSNKANGLVLSSPVPDSADGDTIPDRAEAQDYNSSRSNKANGLVLSSPIPDSADGDTNPDWAEAQDYNSSRSNKANGLSIAVGGVNGNSNHGGKGIDFSLGYRVPINRFLSVEAGAGYALWKFKYKASPLIPEEYDNWVNMSMQCHAWKALTLSAGPVLQIGQKRWQAALYGKAGVTFITIPKQFVGVPNAKGVVTDETGIAKFSGNKTALSVQTGVTLSYSISRILDVFINPHFASTLQKRMSFKEKTLTKKSVYNGDRFSLDKFRELPYEQKAERMQLMGLRIGINLHFLK